jgi:hypothetical protein
MDIREHADAILAPLFARAKAQFGSAIRSYWFYSGDSCPGCGFPVDVTIYKGKEALSLNAFIYRPRGVLIGYLLCGICAQQIFQAAEKKPLAQTPLHTVIEQNLTRAYQRYLASRDA